MFQNSISYLKFNTLLMIQVNLFNILVSTHKKLHCKTKPNTLYSLRSNENIKLDLNRYKRPMIKYARSVTYLN